MNNQLDREEQALEDAYASGKITLKEYNYEMLELHRSFQQYAEDCAQEAYDAVMYGQGYY
jgi:hypothetical protein